MKQFIPDKAAIFQDIQPDYISCDDCIGLKYKHRCIPINCHRLESKADDVASWIEEHCLELKLIREVKKWTG